MDVKLKISIDQNAPSLITSSANYEVITNGIRLVSNSYTQIGIYPNCVRGRDLVFIPSGLTIVPFINDNYKLKCFIERINNFINNPDVDKFEEALKIDDINAIQIIKIKKV